MALEGRIKSHILCNHSAENNDKYIYIYIYIYIEPLGILKLHNEAVAVY